MVHNPYEPPELVPAEELRAAARERRLAGWLWAALLIALFVMGFATSSYYFAERPAARSTIADAR